MATAVDGCVAACVVPDVRCCGVGWLVCGLSQGGWKGRARRDDILDEEEKAYLGLGGKGDDDEGGGYDEDFGI